MLLLLGMTPTPAAPKSEPSNADRPHHDHHLDTPPLAPAASEHDDADAVIKIEDDADPNTPETTPRPDPLPSLERRDLETTDVHDSTTINGPDRPISRKRKRASSPPWIFPTAENSFVKTADGRRVSARVNTATPTAVSESENNGGHGRSASQSVAWSRPSSPPWKKFEAPGPTTLQVDGIRKSGRVNKELGQTPKTKTKPKPKSKSKPTRTSPRTKKTTGEVTPAESKRSLGLSSGPKSLQPDSDPDTVVIARDVRAPSPASRIARLQAQIAALQPMRSFTSPGADSKPAKSAHKRRPSSTEDVEHGIAISRPQSPTSTRRSHRVSHGAHSPDHDRPVPRLKLRLTGQRRVIEPPHPQAQALLPAHPPQLTLDQVIEKYELKEMQQPYMENERGQPDAEELQRRAVERAVEEGKMRRRLLDAGRPGGTLSRQKCSLYFAEPQVEPPIPHTPFDQFIARALNFRHIQVKTRQERQKQLKKLAVEALDYWKKRRGPTQEEKVAEQDRIFKLIYKQCVVDMRTKWEMVDRHVYGLRLQRWEAEEDAKRQARLQKQLAQAELMVAKQRGIEDEYSSMIDDDDDDEDVMAEDSAGDLVAGSETGADDDESGDDSISASADDNMSVSDSDQTGGIADEDMGGEMGEDELAAYLAQRDPEPPDKTDTGDELEVDEEPDEDETSIRMEDSNGGEHDLLMSGALPADEIDEVTEHQNQGEPASNIAQLSRDDSTGGAGESDVRKHSRRSRTPAPDIDDDADDDLSDDESVEMYDSDEDISSTGTSASGDEDADDEEDSDADDSDAEGGLLAGRSMLFKLLDGRNMEKQDIEFLPTPPTTSAEGDGRDCTAEPVGSDQITDGQANAGAAAPESEAQEESMLDVEHGTDIAIASTEVAEQNHPPVDSVEPEQAAHSPSPDAPSAITTKHLVPVPALLRGTLRSYQHTGLDWLASLHRNKTNGILADEMGLGKTIQTIALLAHLAEEKAIWETHLIIVPTSVILNWVTEFQKFLPGFRVLGYYGTGEERKLKRNHWVNDPHLDKERRGYNVVVTSYNVAMQDINAIRNVQWHYLVLDEAHNIRNFNSQRWQVLIRLKTKARLLLTGTPLQNSLTELWSLLTFLTAGDDDPAHGDLEEFLSHWKEPVKEIFDRGVQTLSTEAQKVVDQLHVSLRPFLLRRLKIEVEKDLPKKTESVVVCKLSKRQRQLYQEYMSLASTRESLARGNAVSAGRVLLSLRRVCNHPDLFDPRPIQTSYAFEKSPVEPFVVKENLVKRLLGEKSRRTLPSGLMLVTGEMRRRGATTRSRQLASNAMQKLQRQMDELASTTIPTSDLSTFAGCIASQRIRKREKELQQLRDGIQISSASLQRFPVYGSDLRELLTVRTGQPHMVVQRHRGMPQVKYLKCWPRFGQRPLRFEHKSDWYLSQTTALQQDIWTLESLSEKMHETLTRFVFCTPVATAPLMNLAIPPRIQSMLRASDAYPFDFDPFHEARIRTSIVFPDSRLLIYDSGKLQRLTKLLRDLQAKGSRSLIFTQMTGTLNILERFLNLLNLPYLRLDGSTPVERRQLYSSEFNRPDSKYQCMILSSRAGGVGLNLTGASSVIFYDLDWNPQMDRQCMDRAHRIGQVRDVEVYKMVSEKTVEENILRRASQKSLLDQTVIQEGHFTTEYQQPTRHHVKEKHADGGGEDAAAGVEAAIDRYLGASGHNKKRNHQSAIDSVEDVEDVYAAKKAANEECQDENEFGEKSSKNVSAAATPGPDGDEEEGEREDEDEEEEERKGHVDGYMVRLVEELVRDIPFVPPVAATKKASDRRRRDGVGGRRRR